MNELEFDETCDFIIKLGATALGYGMSSPRLESYLTRVTAALGVRGDFLVLSEEFESVLWQDGGEQRIRVTRNREWYRRIRSPVEQSR